MKSTTSLRADAGTDFRARTGLAVLLLILLATGVQSTLLSISRPFWFDEICTVLMCRMPSAPAIWQALEHGLDTQPPAYYLAERLARQLVPDDHLGYRLPSILGLLAAVSCIYFVLVRRVSRLAALVGASFILCTSFADYAAEARPYALLIACISGAILSWQRIEDSRFYALALAVCLAAATSLHYYAVLAWPAFVLAEATVVIVRRRLRWSAWLALLLGLFPLLLCAKLLLSLHRHYAQHFWARPSFLEIFHAHGELFDMGLHWGLEFAFGLTAVLLFSGFKKASGIRERSQQIAGKTSLPAEDLTLSLVLLWLPASAIVAAIVSHSAMTERYMLPTVLGGALALGYAADIMPVRWRGLLLFLILMQYASVSIRVAGSVLHGRMLEQRTDAIGEVDAIGTLAHRPGLPIVFADELDYLPMAYYTPATSQSKLYAIVDPDAADSFSDSGSDSADLELLNLRQYFPLQVEGYSSFISAHREFLLVADNADNDLGQEWLPARLQHDGYTLTVALSDEAHTVFNVRAGQ